MQDTRWAPRTSGIIACAVAGAVLGFAAATLATDPPGRVLAALAAAGLIGFAGISWQARPKLAITADGLLIRGWLRAQLVTRAEVKTIRISEFRRIGRKIRLLEIETGDDRLVILSRWDLGVPPLEVLDALTAAGYAGR